MAHQKLMTAEKLIKIHNDLKALGVDMILDGGWGVDALLGKETREHKDVDFFIDEKNLETVKKYFASNGYEPSRTEPSSPWHFLLENDDTIVDIHVLDIDEDGRGWYGPKENNAIFTAESLAGEGSIEGVKFRSLTPEYRVECLTKEFGVITRTGYNLKDSDYDDIAKLCQQFKIEMPEEYLVHWGGKKPF